MIARPGKFPAPPLDPFLLALLGAVGIGALAPMTGTAAEILGWTLRFAIAGLFLLYGARLSPQEVWAGVRHWRVQLTLLSIAFVIYPLLAAGVGVLLSDHLPAALVTGIVYVGLVPTTVQSSIALTAMARGNVAAAVVGASLSNIVGVLVTPLLCALLLATTAEIRIDLGVFTAIATQLLLPFVLGQVLRSLIGGWVAAHDRRLKFYDRGTILLVVYSAFGAGTASGIWHTVAVSSIAVMVAVCVGVLVAALLICGVVGRLVGFGPEDRVVVIFLGSMKSLATGLPMATVIFGTARTALIILPLMTFHLIQLMVCTFLAQRMERSSGFPWAKTTDGGELSSRG